jgi:hypothetical protein
VGLTEQPGVAPGCEQGWLADYAGMVAEIVSLQGPVSPRVSISRTMCVYRPGTVGLVPGLLGWPWCQWLGRNLGPYR